ncbi:MAG: carboxypeptidase-like regulatory domain-containing protein [Candidatus Hydrogenedentota bacterium]
MKSFLMNASKRCRFIMVLIALGSILSPDAHAEELATISGQVVDSSLSPVSGAQIFMEPGLTHSILMVTADTNGRFEVTNVPSERVGIFAYAEGFAFNGKSIWLGNGDANTGHTIVLPKAGQLRGRVTTNKKKAVAKAHVIRVLLQNAKVSIPFTKIRRFGFQVPVSDENGGFVVNRLPENETVAVKIAHFQFAHEVLPGIPVGSDSAHVKMSPGVLTSGTVLSRGRNLPVPNAPILFKNPDPLIGATIGRADSTGVYTIRLKPGVYVYESTGTSFTSVTKRRIVVTGETRTQQIDLIVAATATIHGKVLDAVSGLGIPGAKLLLSTEGRSNAVEFTDSNGVYTFTVPEGSNSVILKQAAGYLPPSPPGFSMSVSPYADVEADPFWLKAIPRYSLEVIDEAKEPLEGATILMLRPQQIGWHVTDSDGLVDIAISSLPEDGIVMGFADAPTTSMSALFSIDGSRAKDAIVQLTPTRSIRGQVLDENGKGLEGWAVSCDVSHPDGSAVNLWQTVTNSLGEFTYPSVIEGLALRYTARPLEIHEAITPSPALYTVNASQPAVLPALVIPGGLSGTSLQGKSFRWKSMKRFAGNEKVPNSGTGGSIVVTSNAQNAPMILDSLESMQQKLSNSDLRFCLVVSEPTQLESDSVALYAGTPPASAQSYLLSTEGKVVAETVGIPTFGLIRDHLGN